MQFRSLFKDFGKKSDKKVEIVSGPKACKMNRDQASGKEWSVRFENYKFRVSIEDGVKIDVNRVIKQIARVPSAYFQAFVVVSEEGKNGVAVYPDLGGGAAAHGGKEYINIVPQAEAQVLSHEIGHTLEQVVSAKDPKTLDKWEAAIKADNISVSKYGNTIRHEDLAEFSRIYAVCLDAGPDKLAELQKLSPPRFLIWEKILKGEPAP